jgi:hypothetical protein
MVIFHSYVTVYQRVVDSLGYVLAGFTLRQIEKMDSESVVR